MLLLVVLPGYALAAWFVPASAGGATRLGTGLALSVPLGGTFVAALAMWGVAPGVATGVLLVGSVLSLLAERLLRRTREFAGPGTGRDRRAVALLTVLVVIVTSLFPLLTEWWRVSSDAWTHVAIVRAIETGGMPPSDPAFAGVRLQYAWIYHAFVAGAHGLTGFDVFAIMAVLNAVALAAVALCAGGHLLRTRPGSAFPGLVFLLFGLNALFPLFLPLSAARAFVGEVRGWSELARQFDLLPLEWDRTGVFLRSLGGQDFMLDKFMVATPFALALGAFTAWLAAFHRWLDTRDRGDLVLIALATAAAGLMHPVVLVFLGFASGLLGLAVLLAPRLFHGLRLRLAAAGGALLAGFVPTALYVRTLLGASGGAHHEFPFDLAPLKLLGYVTCLVLGLLFAAAPLARLWRGGGTGRVWAAWVVAGCTVALVFRLPGPSPFFTVDKFSYLVWIPIAMTAASAFSGFLQRQSPRARVLWMLLLFLPVNGLALASRAVDPHNRAHLPWSMAGLVCVRGQTPKAAVLLTPYGDWDTGNLAERDQYYTLDQVPVQLGYDQREIDARRDLVQRFFRTGRLTDADRLRLARLGRPIYAVWTDFSDPRWRWTPGAWARANLTPAPRPPFDSSYPVLWRDDRQEIRRLLDAPGP